MYTFVVMASFGEYDDEMTTCQYAGQSAQEAERVMFSTTDIDKWQQLNHVWVEVWKDGSRIKEIDLDVIKINRNWSGK